MKLQKSKARVYIVLVVTHAMEREKKEKATGKEIPAKAGEVREEIGQDGIIRRTQKERFEGITNSGITISGKDQGRQRLRTRPLHVQELETSENKITVEWR